MKRRLLCGHLDAINIKKKEEERRRGERLKGRRRTKHKKEYNGLRAQGRAVKRAGARAERTARNGERNWWRLTGVLFHCGARRRVPFGLGTGLSGPKRRTHY